MVKFSVKHMFLTVVTFSILPFLLVTRIYLSPGLVPYKSGIDCIPISYPRKPEQITNPVPTVHYGNLTCPKTPKLLPYQGSKVALASFPGSGNSWVRYLMEQSTGYHTGSVYIDHNLRSHGFLEYIFNSSLIAIKTHETYGTINKYFTKSIDYKKCILIVRNPRDTLVAEINRFFTNDHTKSLNTFRWKSEQVQQKLLELVYGWKSFVLSWLNFSRPLLVVQFEKLLDNYRLELERIVNFLGLQFDLEGLECLRHNHSGYFKRSNKSEPYFSQEVLLLIQHVTSVVEPYLARHNISYQGMLD